VITDRLLLLVFSASLAGGVSADAQTDNTGIRVDGAWARRAPMLESTDSKAGSGNSAAYATLVNLGLTPDALIAATSDAAAAVEIHESYQESGMMMMRPVGKIDVPGGRKIEMKPGGYHIMLLNLLRALEPGQVIDLTLVFDNAGKIPVKAPVK
jgi:hypothetical protein